MAARSVARPQSRALARVASLAAFALDDGDPRSPHGDDRGPLHRRGRRVLEKRRGIAPRDAIWEIAGVFSYMLHVIFGLLMLAAIAPTSMAEERQRGSLDILAATALSTRAIVVGKWLGTFRLVVAHGHRPGIDGAGHGHGALERQRLHLGPAYRPITTGGSRSVAGSMASSWWSRRSSPTAR